MEYYVCEYGTGKPLYGPYASSEEVVDFIVTHPPQIQWCNRSRYDLAKTGEYPRNKAGNRALIEAVTEAYARRPVLASVSREETYIYPKEY